MRYGNILNQSKTNSTSNAEANHSPASLDNHRVGETTAKIPHQMADTVHGVVGERKGQGGLEEDLGRERKSAHGSDHGGRFEMPTKSGGGEVSGSPNVQGAGESNTGDTVQGTADPADLGLVDSEVRSDRAVKALLNEDLAGVLGVRGRSNLSVDQCMVSMFFWRLWMT
jgi:hypothetical protein